MRRVTVNLQGRVVALIVVGMAIILMLSAYLHGLITTRLLEEDRYDAALTQTVGIGERMAAQQLLEDAAALRDDILLVRDSRPEFEQIDVWGNSAAGLVLKATTVPGRSRLPSLTEASADNDLHEMEHPLPGLVTMEVERNGLRFWAITLAVKQRSGTGYVNALVRKNSFSPLVRQLQFQHNAVLAGAIAITVLLFSALFAHFFRSPARDIVRAMTAARHGDFRSRAAVRRDDELGEIAAGFNAMIEDLSARDQEREAMLTTISGFNRELRREVAGATGQLRAANDALFQSQRRLARSERFAAMGQVAASLAHEIGTPLNSISGHLALLSRRLPGDAEAERRVGIINQQLESIVHSVRALLRRAHKRRVTLRPIKLNALLGELSLLVGPTLEAHGIELVAPPAPEAPTLLADRDALQQVFLNLINNSIDAMPQGGGIAIETRVRGGMAELSIRDTGTGVPPEYRADLFEPMWTTKATGTGFGLAIAREIMSEHGGDIVLDAEAGAGTTFRLRVPLADAALATTGIGHVR